MRTAKVIGHIWATRKAVSVNGLKLLLAEILDGKDAGERLVVADTMGAGIGDKVIITAGSAARRLLEDDCLPIDAAVLGIIDKDCEF